VYVAVCVGDDADNAEIVRRCRAVGEQNNIEIGFQSYGSPSEMAEELRRESYRDSLHILVTETAGEANTAIEIRKTGFSGIIIEMSDTQSVGDIEKVFDAEVFNFVVRRKNSDSRFEEVLLKAIWEITKRQQKHIILTFGGDTRKIPLGDIVMFETENRMIKVTYGQESFLFRSTLDSLEERLGTEGFCRVQRSFLISIDRIRAYTKSAVTLDNGAQLPFGRLNKQTALAQIENWLTASAPSQEADK
jgi:DNA-binding LytR/AlgR family response regulator